MADGVVTDLYLSSVSGATPKEPRYFQQSLQQGMYRIPVFNVKEVDTCAKDLPLVLTLNAQSLVSMDVPRRCSSRASKLCWCSNSVIR